LEAASTERALKCTRNRFHSHVITSRGSRLNQLKFFYRDISHLETKLLADSGKAQDENHIVIKGGPAGADEAGKTRWKNLIDDLFIFLRPQPYATNTARPSLSGRMLNWPFFLSR
jgi:hypothetical protein